ncbi:MAG: tripartite tricarboxylate transporter substrate binding protein [Deltaproteobacteria bacterium]|jgi:tripartite-type tricarboxylate transporter receptor subunit TctC|nr:tripartite tricarboxylate transporter substrate binding protein [Deltaproteobacteria bacterium]
MKKILASLFAAALLLGVGASAQAAYPDQPITMLCAWDAGGGTDACARIVATLMQQELGVPVNVVNRTGGSGAVGHQAMVSAKPDGYTLGLASVEISMMHWMDIAKFTAKDFTGIAGVNFDPAGITVRFDAPWKDYKEFEAHVKANPGKIKNSGTGVGGIWHLAQGAWLTTIGLPADAISWIPSRGAAPAMQDLAAGGIDMSSCSLPEAASMIEAKKARPLAIMADVRDPKYPDTPTLKELGINVSAIGAWRGVVGPVGMPQDIVDKLEAVVSKVVQSKEFIDFMNGRGYGIQFMPAKEFTAFMAKADDANGVIMKAAGLVK